MKRLFRLGLTFLACGLGACQTPAASGPRITHFFSDLDGTLLTNESQVTDDMKAAVSRLRQAGVKVGVATGRTLATAFELAGQLQVDLPIVSANGAVIVSPEGKLVRLLGIDNVEDVAAMCAAIDAGKCNHVYTAYAHRETGETRILEGACKPADDPAWPAVKLRGRDCADLPGLLKQVAQIAGGRYSVIESGTGVYHGVSVSALGVGKELALTWLSEQLGVPLDKMAFVGDSNNDLAAARLLHEKGGLCFAVKNGTPDLLAACPRHTQRTNQEGGVIEVIDQLLKLLREK